MSLLQSMYQAMQRRAPKKKPLGLGHPLYMNGRLVDEPVNFSHVPGPVGNYYDVPAGTGDVDPSMGGLGAYAAYYANLGADPLPGSSPASLPPAPAPASSPDYVSPLFRVWRYVAPVSALACAYHGYKRNKSIGWAIGWFLLGGIPLTPVIAFAQGFGQPKAGLTPNPGKRKHRRRRRHR